MIDFIQKWEPRRTGLRALQIVDWLGIGRSKYYDWRQRYGQANEHNRLIPRDHWLQVLQGISWVEGKRSSLPQ